MTDFHVIIPSRLDSKRLPDKALAEICGVQMIVHVARRSMLSRAKNCYCCGLVIIGYIGFAKLTR